MSQDLISGRAYFLEISSRFFMLRLFMMSNEKYELPAVLMPNISLGSDYVISSLLEHFGF